MWVSREGAEVKVWVPREVFREGADEQVRVFQKGASKKGVGCTRWSKSKCKFQSVGSYRGSKVKCEPVKVLILREGAEVKVWVLREGASKSVGSPRVSK